MAQSTEAWLASLKDKVRQSAFYQAQEATLGNRTAALLEFLCYRFGEGSPVSGENAQEIDDAAATKAGLDAPPLRDNATYGLLCIIFFRALHKPELEKLHKDVQLHSDIMAEMAAPLPDDPKERSDALKTRMALSEQAEALLDRILRRREKLFPMAVKEREMLAEQDAAEKLGVRGPAERFAILMQEEVKKHREPSARTIAPKRKGIPPRTRDGQGLSWQNLETYD